MSAHVSVFELKRFAEERLGSDELPAFERHLAACGSCAEKLSRAATRELHARGHGALLGEPSRPVGTALIALAASVLFALFLGQGPARFAQHPSGYGAVEVHGFAPLIPAPSDAGDGSYAFFDGGKRR